MRILPVVLAFALVTTFVHEAASAPARRFEPLSAGAVSDLMSSPTCHVRAVDARMADLIARGMQRSGTFAHLVLALNASNVIVYIESRRLLPTTIAGRLMFAAGPEGFRYLRVQVAALPSSDELIALVAHELRHALEVADAPDVSDEAGLRSLYERIGDPWRGAAMHQYDTVAARETGRQVRAELAS